MAKKKKLICRNQIDFSINRYTFLLIFIVFFAVNERPVFSSFQLNKKPIPEDSIFKTPVFTSFPADFEYNLIRCILKDYKGYMWFGTSNGLVRFDGVNLHVYENIAGSTNSTSYIVVNTIIEDENKNLWIGAATGLYIYNRKKDVLQYPDTIEENIYHSYIKSLCIDKKSCLWIGTYGFGLNFFDPVHRRFENYMSDENNPVTISSNHINCLIFDRDENLWIGTQKGLNVYSAKNKVFKRFYHENKNQLSLSSNNISTLTLDLKGNLWIGTRGGGINKVVKKNDDYFFERYTTDSKAGTLSSNFIISLVCDRRGFLWIGTENGGLNQLNTNNGSIKIYRMEEGNEYSINSNSIWSLYNDDEDRIWIGTYNRGLNVIDEKFRKFELYQRNIFSDITLSNNNVMGFAQDRHGNVWIATDGGGICCFSPESRKFSQVIINNNKSKKIANNAVQTILCDSEDNLWIGTWEGGVDRFNRDGIKIRNYKTESEPGIGNNDVLTLYQDLNGNIWAGTAGSGLFRFDKKADKFNPVYCSVNDKVLTGRSYVASILMASDSTFLVATMNGLIMLKINSDNSIECINFQNEKDNPLSLSSNSINIIFEDSKGRIWCGTAYDGLNLYNKKDNTFSVFRKQDGLSGNSIKGILEDDNGCLWISTNNGISKFNTLDNSFINFSKEDGLNSNEFNVRACLRTKNGEFYFGGENGFNIFHPESIKSNPFIPPVYLTELRINNKPATIGVKGSPLNKHIGETTEIELKYNQSSFSFEFSALNYTLPSKNQFSYKLEGFDKDWIYNGTRRNAYYTNIPPGKYVFLVKGSNNDGLWNNTPAKLKVIIKPPVWKNWWAIVIYALVLIVIAYVSLKTWNERIKIKNQLKLEQLGREKEHELNEYNIQFFTNISHEFRTPLSLIFAPIENLLSSACSRTKEQLMIIYRNAERLLQLTNNLLDFRKFEDGIAKLKVQCGDILKCITEVSSYFSVDSSTRNIDFKVETTENSIYGWFDPGKLETILLNLLSNAFKFTSDYGRIRLVVNIKNALNNDLATGNYRRNISPESQDIEIAVIDNGKGILPEELPFVFDKFYQGTSSGVKRNSGTGIGLALTKGLIEMHNGEIWVESTPYTETRFIFKLPIDRYAYQEDNLVFEPVGSIKRSAIKDIEYAVKKEDYEALKKSEKKEERADILIVDDNEELRTYLTKELSGKFNIAQADDGKIGIELAQTLIPDLIVSDILMPQCNGIDLCKAVKSDLRTCHIPVILLTAKNTINEQIEGIETGADAYIIKPFNVQFLFAQINQLIRSRRELYSHFSKDVYLLPNKMAHNEMDQKFLQKAIDYVILNITDNSLNVEGLAEHLNLSHSNVYRKIKALTGETIVEFIKTIRLKQAIKLMETKQYSLSEIAYMIGFTSPSYFTKSFRNQYGKPPSEFLSD